METDDRAGEGKPAEAEAQTPPAAAPDAALAALVQRLQKQLDDVTGKLGGYQLKDEAEREKKLRDKGDYERLIKERDDKLAAQARTLQAREERFRRTERDRAFASALGSLGIDLVEGAADDLLALWGSEFEASEDEDGGFRVLTKDLKSPAQVLKERLASPRYEHFVKAGSRGSRARAADGSRPADSGQAGAGPETPDNLFTRMAASLGRGAAPGLTLGFGTRR